MGSARRAAGRARPGRHGRRRAGSGSDGVAVLSGFVPRVEGGDAEIDRVVRILEEAELSPPSLAELERQTGRRDIGAILRLAAASGRVEAVERERYYARPALERFAATLAEIGREQPDRAGRAPGPAGHQPQVHDPLAGMGRRQGDHRARRGRAAAPERLTPRLSGRHLQTAFASSRILTLVRPYLSVEVPAVRQFVS